MPSLRQPGTSQVVDHLAKLAGLPVTYAPVGGIWAQPPRGFAVDHTRHPIGRGRPAFEAGCDAIRSWTMFDLGWARAVPPDAPIRKGSVVAVVARTFGLWTINPSRIIEVIDEATELRDRFGFTYATLPGHVERGQERFLIEWIRSDDSVWYDVLAYSRPQHPLVKLASPLARLAQRRFKRDTKVAMDRAIAERLRHSNLDSVE